MYTRAMIRADVHQDEWRDRGIGKQ